MKNKHNLISKALLILLLTVSSLADAQQWQELDTGVSECLYGIYCIDTNTVFTCGHNGVIMKTEDGGNSWQEKYRNEGNCLYNLCFVNDEVGFAYGDVLVKTTDGGNSWSLIDTQYLDGEKQWSGKDYGSYYKTARIHAIDADTLYFVSPWRWGRLYKSTDGGTTASFILRDHEFWDPDPEENMCRLFFEDNTGYIVYIGDYSKVVIYKTMNFGSSWEKVFEIDDGIFADHVLVHFINKDEIKLFGAPEIEPFLNWDNVICTNDGFASTMSERSYSDIGNSFSFLHDSKFTSSETGCYISKTGMYGDGICFSAITNDGGSHWKLFNNGLSDELDVYGVGGIDTIYFLAAENGRVYRIRYGMEQIMESSEQTVSICPNPTKDRLVIKGVEVAEVKVYNIVGQLLKSEQSTNLIGLEGFPESMYFISITDKEGRRYVHKVMKE